MDKKKLNLLFIIVSVLLTLSGIIFLPVSIFGEEKNNWYLASALFCILLSNLFNIIRVQFNKQK